MGPRPASARSRSRARRSRVDRAQLAGSRPHVDRAPARASRRSAVVGRCGPAAAADEPLEREVLPRVGGLGSQLVDEARDVLAGVRVDDDEAEVEVARFGVLPDHALAA